MITTDFLARLKGVKKTSNGYMALCPAHDDKNPSLSITEGTDGRILIRCFADCGTGDIVQALGLQLSDLFLDNQKAKGARAAGRSDQGQIVAVYQYADANGKPFEVVRYNPKGFLQRRPDGNGGHIWNLKGLVPTLYKQDKLIQAIDSGKCIHVVEGEKDADRLWSMGLIATTNPGGVGTWRDRYSETLRGANVIILPDKDKAGLKHAQKVAASLHGIAASVKVLELPGEGKDVTDWLDHGGDTGQLNQLADACLVYEPGDNGVRLWCMADVKIEPVSWLWEPYIPKGKLTLLEGDPGIGKSWVSLAIASAVTLGKGLPGQEPGEPAKVVMASAEDGLGDTIRPRLDVMGADVSKVFAIDGALVLDENGFTMLNSYLTPLSPALLIIDPLVAYLGAGVDIHRANETRAVMAQLSRLGKTFGVAILAIRHLTKGGMAKAIYRGLGSIDFTAACRSVLLAGCDSENSQNRALVHIKSNLAPTGPAIGYELREGGFYWTGESTLTAAQILATESGKSKPSIDEAVEFLKDKLINGALPAKQVYDDAEGIGISKRTLERAKAQLGVRSRKRGQEGERGAGVWVWELPDDIIKVAKDIPPNSENRSYGGLRSPNSLSGNVGDLNNSEAKKGLATKGVGDLDNDDITSHPPNSPLRNCFDEKPPLKSDSKPTDPCFTCGCGDYWLTSWGKWLCRRCRPEPCSDG